MRGVPPHPGREPVAQGASASEARRTQSSRVRPAEGTSPETYREGTGHHRDHRAYTCQETDPDGRVRPLPLPSSGGAVMRRCISPGAGAKLPNREHESWGPAAREGRGEAQDCSPTSSGQVRQTGPRAGGCDSRGEAAKPATSSAETRVSRRALSPAAVSAAGIRDQLSSLLVALPSLGF